MPLKQGKNFIMHRSFSDFDEYAEVLTRGQWDMDLEQLGRGEFTGDLVSLSVGPFLINHMKVNKRFLIRGQTRQETSIVGLPIIMQSSGSWMRKSFGLDSVQGDPVSVQQLRHQVSSSRSTLERAFAEHFGIKPKAYLMARRLNGVRKMLKTTDPEVGKILDVASRWGFWHMSQFAADYRRQFGELPSETLSRH